MKILKRIKRLFTRKNKIHPQHGNDDVTSKQCVICYENTVSKPPPNYLLSPIKKVYPIDPDNVGTWQLHDMIQFLKRFHTLLNFLIREV